MKTSKKLLNRIILDECRHYLMESSFSLNVANTPLENAIEYSEREFSKAGQDLYTVIPNFDENYLKLKELMNYALDIPRIDMPVIEPSDMNQFQRDLESGHIDIFKPNAISKDYFPTDLNKQTGKEWLTLGTLDGHPTDDIVKGKWTSISASKLKPTQGQIWLENVVPNIIKFGVPTSSSPIAKATIIVSKDGYILDGHHRYGQAVLANPTLKLNSLLIPLKITTLLKVGVSYGDAIGNVRKA